MLIAIAYGVRDDKRRARPFDALQNYGKRVQLSVFECLLDEPQAERMRRTIERIIATEEDTVRIYRQCGVCESRSVRRDCGERRDRARGQGGWWLDRGRGQALPLHPSQVVEPPPRVGGALAALPGRASGLPQSAWRPNRDWGRGLHFHHIYATLIASERA